MKGEEAIIVEVLGARMDIGHNRVDIQHKIYLKWKHMWNPSGISMVVRF